MPCQVYETEEEKQANRRAHFRHNSDVAEMLCAVCKEGERAEILMTTLMNIPGLGDWWKEHKLRDVERAKLDAAKQDQNLVKFALLSRREAEVLVLIAKGAQPANIALTLGISSKTVSTYRNRIIDKLKLPSTAQMALFAHKLGLV